MISHVLKEPIDIFQRETIKQITPENSRHKSLGIFVLSVVTVSVLFKSFLETRIPCSALSLPLQSLSVVGINCGRGKALIACEDTFY